MVELKKGRDSFDDQTQVAVSLGQLRAIHRDLDACQKVIWLAGVRPRGYGFDPAYCSDAQARLSEIDTLIASVGAQAEQRAGEVMLFLLKHPDTGDAHTVALTRSDIADGMDDTLFEKLGDLMCDCQPVGETNVVDCNCDDYIQEFELVNAAPVAPTASHALSAENARLFAQIEERDAVIEEWSGTAVQNGMECDRLAGRVAELEAELGRQHEAHRKTWRQLEQAQAELAALKAGGVAHG